MSTVSYRETLRNVPPLLEAMVLMKFRASPQMSDCPTKMVWIRILEEFADLIWARILLLILF